MGMGLYMHLCAYWCNKDKRSNWRDWQGYLIIPSNLSPCPCPRQSEETAIAATSPHFSSRKGKRAAQAMIWPSLSTTVNESNDSRSCIKENDNQTYKISHRERNWQNKLSHHVYKPLPQSSLSTCQIPLMGVKVVWSHGDLWPQLSAFLHKDRCGIGRKSSDPTNFNTWCKIDSIKQQTWSKSWYIK